MDISPNGRYREKTYAEPFQQPAEIPYVQQMEENRGVCLFFLTESSERGTLLFKPDSVPSL